MTAPRTTSSGACRRRPASGSIPIPFRWRPHSSSSSQRTTTACSRRTRSCVSHRCLRARAIATDTAAMFRSGETIIPGTTTANQLSMASDGHDYLLAWNDYFCEYPCNASVPRRMLALRLGADGRALDFEADRHRSSDRTTPRHTRPSAWTGSKYAVAGTRAPRTMAATSARPARRTPSATCFAATSRPRRNSSRNGNDLFLLFTSQTRRRRQPVVSSRSIPQSLAADRRRQTLRRPISRTEEPSPRPRFRTAS